jgi:regulator of replication initiation timing
MLKTIKDAVQEVTGLKINKKTRQREYVMARCLYYHFARELTNRPFAEIGAVTNHNHATVIHSLKSFDVHYKFDDFFKKSFRALAIILEPTPSKEQIIAEVGSIDELIRQRQSLIDENVNLKLEIKNLKDNLPNFNKYFDGIPQERVQFFINNQLSAFIKMERATIKKLESYEQANAKIRETKQTAKQASFEETGIRVRNKAYKSSRPC